MTIIVKSVTSLLLLLKLRTYTDTLLLLLKFRTYTDTLLLLLKFRTCFEVLRNQCQKPINAD